MNYIVSLDENGVLYFNTLLLFPLHSTVLIQRCLAKGSVVYITHLLECRAIFYSKRTYSAKVRKTIFTARK